MEKTIGLTDSQANFAIKQICRWMNTCEDNERHVISSADVSHSSLLYRLLKGLPLLEKAPPKRFSYPCYELAEGKEVAISEVHENSGAVWADFDNVVVVVVDQGAEYMWHNKEKQVLRHVPTGDLYQLSEREIAITQFRNQEFVEVLKMQKFMQKIEH
jgi:hypothetical protein